MQGGITILSTCTFSVAYHIDAVFTGCKGHTGKYSPKVYSTPESCMHVRVRNKDTKTFAYHIDAVFTGCKGHTGKYSPKVYSTPESCMHVRVRNKDTKTFLESYLRGSTVRLASAV